MWDPDFWVQVTFLRLGQKYLPSHPATSVSICHSCQTQALCNAMHWCERIRESLGSFVLGSRCKTLTWSVVAFPACPRPRSHVTLICHCFKIPFVSLNAVGTRKWDKEECQRKQRKQLLAHLSNRVLGDLAGAGCDSTGYEGAWKGAFLERFQFLVTDHS